MKISRPGYASFIAYFFRTAERLAKNNYLTFIKLDISLVFFSGIFLTGCINTEGTLILKGKVTDKNSDLPIPGRDIIVQGLLEDNNTLMPVDAGHFSTDSSGCFSFTLNKIKGAYSYKFSLVGDSDYAFLTRTMNIMELEQNAQFLFFTLSRLVNITIKIYRKSKTPACDTLYLSWESDGIEGRILYPYTIDNYGGMNDHFGLISGVGLRWIGGTVNSTVRTRVFADKKTKIYWDLFRNRKRNFVMDTITCRREAINLVNFIY